MAFKRRFVAGKEIGQLLDMQEKHGVVPGRSPDSGLTGGEIARSCSSMRHFFPIR